MPKAVTSGSSAAGDYFSTPTKGQSRTDRAARRARGEINASPANKPVRAPRAPAKKAQKADVDVAFANFQARWEANTSGSRTVSIGGGPRGTTQETAYDDLVLQDDTKARMGNIKAAGGHFNVMSAIIDLQDDAWFGGGNSMGPNQGGGTVNTGAENLGMDLRPRLENHYIRNKDAFEQKYGNNQNPIAHTTFTTAFTGGDAPGGGRPLVGRGAITRADQGQEEHNNFKTKKTLAEAEHPEYSCTLLPKTMVTHIDISNPDTPVLTLNKVGADGKPGDELGKLTADRVVKNTGTYVTSPIRNPAVAQHTYAKPMNSDDIADFNVAQGFQQPGQYAAYDTRVGSGGSGLSQYDQDIALHPNFNLWENVERSPAKLSQGAEGSKERLIAESEYITKIKFTDDAVANRQGAVLMLSNTEGKWIPPRHADKDISWNSPHTDALLDSEMLHAATMHNRGEDSFDSAHWAMLGSIALSVEGGEKSPSELFPKEQTTKDYLAGTHVRNLQFIKGLEAAKVLKGEAEALDAAGQPEAAKAKREEAEQAMIQGSNTREGDARRLMTQGLIGFGGERNMGEAAGRMGGQYPLSWVEPGYSYNRRRLAALSQPTESGEVPNNAKEFNVLNMEWMPQVTASPAQVHETAFQGITEGVYDYKSGNYNNIKKNEGEGKNLTFEDSDGKTHALDAFYVSPTFDVDAEPAGKSMAGQSKPEIASLPQQHRIGVNRGIETKDGVISNVQDYGLDQKGRRVPQGGGSYTGVNAWDTNNKESATDVAPRIAKQRLTVDYLAASRHDNPMQVAKGLYDQVVAERYTPEAWDAEVTNNPALKAAYDKVGLVAAQVKVADEVAAQVKQPGAFRQAFRSLQAGAPVADAPDGLKKHFASIQDRVRDKLEDRPAFKPRTLQDQLRTLKDLPQEIHDEVNNRAYNMAMAKLAADNGGAPRPTPSPQPENTYQVG
jgi:hypothetical protein